MGVVLCVRATDRVGVEALIASVAHPLGECGVHVHHGVGRKVENRVKKGSKLHTSILKTTARPGVRVPQNRQNV
jgi:hypothetical protein